MEGGGGAIKRTLNGVPWRINIKSMTKYSKLMLGGFLLLWLLGVVCSQTPKLVYVQQVFRHGHRYPLYGSPLDGSNFINEIRSPGELTKQGKSMHYILGQQLYKAYWSQLFGNTPYSTTYNQSKFYVKSTNVNRTIESVQSQLLGIFENLDTLTLNDPRDVEFSLPQWPNATRQPGNVYVNPAVAKFNPVPVHVEKGYMSPWDKGDFLRAYSPQFCPNQDVWLNQNLQRPEVKAIIEDPVFQSAIAQVSAALNKTLAFTDIYKFYDNYVCMLYDGRTVNSIWTTPGATKNALDAIYVLDLYLKYFYTEEQLAATATGYFNETYNHFKRIAADQTGVQWAFYSAHDTTVGNFLARLNLTNAKCVYDNFKKGVTKNSQSKTCIVEYPLYTSNLIFEAYKYPNGTTTFKIRYNGELRGIPFCDWQEECTVEKYYAWFESWRNVDFVKTCGVVAADDSSTAFSVAVLEAGVILAFLITFLYRHLEHQHERDDEKLLEDIEKDAEVQAEAESHQNESNRRELSDSLVTDG